MGQVAVDLTLLPDLRRIGCAWVPSRRPIGEHHAVQSAPEVGRDLEGLVVDHAMDREVRVVLLRGGGHLLDVLWREREAVRAVVIRGVGVEVVDEETADVRMLLRELRRLLGPGDVVPAERGDPWFLLRARDARVQSADRRRHQVQVDIDPALGGCFRELRHPVPLGLGDLDRTGGAVSVVGETEDRVRVRVDLRLFECVEGGLGIHQLHALGGGLLVVDRGSEVSKHGVVVWGTGARSGLGGGFWWGGQGGCGTERERGAREEGGQILDPACLHHCSLAGGGPGWIRRSGG